MYLSDLSPKSNTWSAIPAALLCVIVNLSGGGRAEAPKGTKSCRTQGDFCSFVYPPICCDLMPERADLKPLEVYIEA